MSIGNFHKLRDDAIASPTSTTPVLSRRYLGEAGLVLPLIAACILFAAINPDAFLTFRNLRAILDLAALPLILSAGATLVILMGRIDLSIEGVMAAAGLTFVLLSANNINSNNFGIGAFIAALVVSALLGLLTGLVHISLRVPAFMSSLGVWYIGLGIATILFGDIQPQLTGSVALSWASATPLGVSNSFIVAFIIVAITIWISRNTVFGRYCYAIGEDENIARLMSIPVKRAVLLCYVFAALCSGVAGVLATMRLGVGVVQVGNGQLFSTVAAVVVGGTALSGGRGSLGRSVIGVFLLTVISNGLVLSGVSTYIQTGVSGVVIVIAVVAAAWKSRSALQVVK